MSRLPPFEQVLVHGERHHRLDGCNVRIVVTVLKNEIVKLLLILADDLDEQVETPSDEDDVGDLLAFG